LKLQDLKNEFATSLSGLYPSEEIKSFFTILSEKFLALSRIDIALNSDKVISEAIAEKFTKAMVRLNACEPVQYITGETEFYSLPFKVNKHTLIPRPETEELVDWIVEESKTPRPASKTQHRRPRTQDPGPRTLLDIGTGSGCIAISLAKSLPQYQVSGLDFSSEALKIANENAVLNEVSIDFFEFDILTTDNLPECYNIIVSNPPYIRELEKKEMQPNVLWYEPQSALFVPNDDPFLFYRKIAVLAKNHLVEGGFLYFEINEYLGNELFHLLESYDFHEIILKKDIFGKNRMMRCTKYE
jgi:release factor glutamine methyltransferase